MDKGLFGWIYLLNPCGCPPISDDDPKECQQLISQRAGKSHYTSHNLHVLKEPFQTLHFTSCLKRFFFSPSHLHYPTNTLDISALEMSALIKLKRDFLRIVLVGRVYMLAQTHTVHHVSAHGFPHASHPHHQIPVMLWQGHGNTKTKNTSSHP